MFLLTKKNTSTLKKGARPGYVRYINMIGNDSFVDWIIILSVSGLIALSLIVVGSYVYVDTESQLSAQGNIAPTSINSSHFDVKKLAGAVSLFDARANERVMLSKGYVGPRDPSLP